MNSQYFSAKRSVTWVFMLVVICMSIFTWFTYTNMQDTLKEVKSVGIALKSLRILEAIQENMLQMETAERGYVITGNRENLVPYLIAKKNMQEDLVILQSLVTDDSTRRLTLEKLQRLVKKKTLFTDAFIRLKDSAGYEAASKKIKTGLGREIMDSIHALIYSTETADRVVLRESNRQRLKKAEYTSTLFFMLSGVFFLGFVISCFIIQRNLRRQQQYQAELLYLSTLVRQTSETIFSTDPRFMAMERDISDRKLAEEELIILNQHLRDRAKQLALSNSELEQFAYVASHDLQEPLRMVSSFMDLLKRNYGTQMDDKAGQYIGFALDGTIRMKQLIMDLLEYSRVGTNKDEFVNTDMNKVVQEVAGIFTNQVAEEMPEISYPVMPTVVANKSQMAQLFQNLLGNAIKYKGAEKAVIRIGYTENDSCFTFSIQDNGIGIDQAHYDRIFILFQRLHLRDEYSGTGIGLTICKKIVEKHGGTIWVNSEPGKGSTFYFTIRKQL